MSKEAVITNVSVIDGAVLVDAYSVERVSTNYTAVPLLNSFDGLITVPREGQKVIIAETEQGTEYVEGVLTTVGSEAPALAAEEFVLQFDPTTSIEAVKDGAGGFDLTIKASGDVALDAANQVTIGDDANAVEVAVQDHSHDFSGTDSNGDSFSGTTTTPVEEGTSTKME